MTTHERCEDVKKLLTEVSCRDGHDVAIKLVAEWNSSYPVDTQAALIEELSRKLKERLSSDFFSKESLD